MSVQGVCDICECPYEAIWSAPDDLWVEAFGDEEYRVKSGVHFVCVECFHTIMEEATPVRFVAQRI